MESTAQFSLDDHVAIWRSELANTGNLNKEDLDELESHLLDEIDQLSNYPLSRREAFMIAKDRIGNQTDLSSPYAQAKSLWSLFLTRSNFYLQAVLILSIVSLTTRAVEFITVLSVNLYNVPVFWGSYIYSGLLVVFFTAIFLWLRYISRRAIKRSRRISFTGHLTIVTLFVAACVIIFAYEFAGAPFSAEIMSVFILRQYIWIAGFLIAFAISLISSIKDFKSFRIKSA